ncbi:MAG TPA: 3-oxoadipate enol-lactonase [Burkholderiales bacterium]
MPRIRANGIEINYALDGPPAGPVVMLSNSLLTDYRMWEPQVPALARNYRVLRYDTRGHGGSEASEPPYSMAMLADDAVGLLDALEIARVHFVGLSMGGMIGQRLASRYPERVASLALCDTAARMPPASVWDERIALAQAKGTAAFVEPMTTRWLTEAYRASHADVLRGLAAMISGTSVPGFVGCCRAIQAMDHVELLATIKAPTLVLVGEHDVGTPVAAAEALHRGIAGSELRVLRDAAHLTNIEQTQAFNEALTGFLARAQAGRP